MFTMLIGSDLVPTESNYDLFEAADVKTLAGEALLTELAAADFRIFNLETPLTDVASPIPKCGPNLITPTRTLPGIRAFKPSLLALANNHILDQGDEAMFNTMRLLEENGLPYMGVGHNLAEAQKPYVIKKDGKTIGIYNCGEHEFTIAEENKPGANPFEPLESLDHIATLKALCDYVVVLYHGGKEHYRYASPQLQRVCRKMAEKGADLVVCQHSHCVGCMEHYGDSVIVYGQGNFLFDHSESECWQTSLLVKAEFGESLSVSFVSLVKCGRTVRMAEGEEAETIMNGFYERSREILDPVVLKERYRAFCLSDKRWYLYAMTGGEANTGIAAENFEPHYTKEGLLIMKNYLTCEPHREMLSAIVEALLSEN